MSANRWLVPITALRRATGSRRLEVRSGRVGPLHVGESSVGADAEAVAEVALDAIDGGIEVSGTVEAPWQGECRRCLKPVSGRLRCQVREVYRPRAGHEPEDEDTYPLDAELLDLAPMVRDALLLDLPIAPLCRDDCRGLCPSCGADLNDGPCSCPQVAVDPRWQALEALRPEPRGAQGGPNA